MSWARRLKRVFGIQIEGCARCGGRLKIIASIEEPQVVARILAHLEKSAPDQYQCELPLGVRAPPGQASQRSERTGWCMPALRPVPGEGGSRAGKPGSTGNEGQGGRPGAFLAGTLAGFRAVTASPVPT